MIERNISSFYLVDSILHGEIIEEYEVNMLIAGWFNEEPIHVICFYDNNSDSVCITSVYRPDLFHFEDDYKTRRKL
jgi:hypothetical protein